MSVNGYVKGLASNLVLTSNEKNSISISIDTIENRLKKYFGNKIKKSFIFGSYTRQTILPRKADKQSDIDYMIVFENNNNYKPQTFLERLKRFANKYYSTSEIFQSHPTMVLELNHIKFELVPAYHEIIFTYIPAPSSNFENWMTTEPKKLKNKVENANKNNNFKIKPLIRLMKYWNAKNDYVYNSHELENNILNGFYLLNTNLKEYLYSAFENLNTYNLPKYKKNKVERAKMIINNVKKYENKNMPHTAESEIKDLLPNL